MPKKKKKIIAVDDSLISLTALKNILKPYYEVYTASSAAKMFELLTKITPDLILLDVEMPDLSGYEAAHFMKKNREYKSIPIIFITSRNDVDSEMEGFELGAVDYINKPYAAPLLLKRIETQLAFVENEQELQDLNATMQKKLISQVSQVFDLKSAVINIVAELVEFRDGTTGGHISRTEKYLQYLIEKLMDENVYTDQLSSWDMDFLLPSSQLHDVGKIAISDAILKKPGKLTDEEFEIMKTHPQIGVEAIDRMERKTADTKFFSYAKTFAGTHHEKWDGSGYPKGLKGLDIPLEGRLMAIADVYDALVSARPYKEPFPYDTAAEIIEEGRGTLFDPRLVDIFNMVSRDFANIARILAE